MARSILGVVITGLVYACVSSAIADDGNKSAKEVWEHHLKGVEQHNLDLFMSDIADNATVILDDGVYVGKAQLRAKAAQYLSAMPLNAMAAVKVEKPQFGEHAIVWPFRLGNRQALDSVYVENGKIVFISEITWPPAAGETK